MSRFLFRFPLRPFVLVLGALALLAAAGCNRQRETAVASGNRDQILHIGNLTEPNDLDPQIADSQQTANLCEAFFEGLAQYDPQTCEPEPAVATSWESDATATQWTFHLRPEARWSNGDPVTAHDFVFAFRRILSPKLAAEYASMLYVLKNGRAFNEGRLTDPAQIGAVATDDHTLVLTLEHPVPYLPTMVCHCAWYPLNRSAIAKYGPLDERGSSWTLPGHLVGNGYFVLAEWKQHQYIRGTKSPTYWDRDHVKLREVYFYPIESEDAEERAFRSGQLHITTTLPIAKVATYSAEHSPFYHPHPFLGTFFLRFNTRIAPLNDVRVRRALSLAIDRRKFVDDVMRAHQLPGDHLTPPGTAGFDAPGGFVYDPDLARRLLAEAGYPGGRGFPRLEFLYNSTEANRLIAEALQQMWNRALGIDISMLNQEAKVQVVSMRSGNYQIGRYAWIGDYLDPSTFLEIMTGDSGNNETGWRSADYDRLYAEANQLLDRDQRYALFRKCEQILADEAPIAPIYFYTRNNLRRPEVKGWYGNLLDVHPLKGVYLDASAAVP